MAETAIQWPRLRARRVRVGKMQIHPMQVGAIGGGATVNGMASRSPSLATDMMGG